MMQATMFEYCVGRRHVDEYFTERVKEKCYAKGGLCELDSVYSNLTRTPL
jgi:hypothetical protein